MAGESTSLLLRSGHGAASSSASFTFQTLTNTVAAALPSTPSSRRKKGYDRFYYIGARDGWLAKGTAGNGFLYITGPTEADWLVNLFSPGTLNLTKVSTPTFSADAFVAATSAATYYETGLGIQTVNQNSHTFGVYSKTSGAANDVVMGAQDAGAVGITLAPKLSSNNFVNFRSMSVATSGALVSPYDGAGLTSVTRIDASNVRVSRHGVKKETFSLASSAPSTNPTIRILAAAGNASFTTKHITCAFWFNTALTENEEHSFCAALRDLCDKITWGFLDYFNPDADKAVVTKPIWVYDNSIASIMAAYEAKRQGQNVGIVCDWMARGDWEIGGEMTNGLGYIDATSYAAVSGLAREVLKQINLVYYVRTDANTQVALSVESKAWLAAIRSMLDPARTFGTLPGLDIPVFYSQGVSIVNKTGAKIMSFQTFEGRQFIGQCFIGADQEGQFLKAAGVPYITGQEPTGSGGEQFNGYLGVANFKLPSSTPGGTARLDVYNTPATPASGLLPDIIAVPGLATGAADPGLQGMNFREALNTATGQMAEFDLTAPPNYNPLRQEALGRLYAVAPTQGFDSKILKVDLENGTVYDGNNGSDGLSSDLPQSGVNYALATTNAARLAVVNDLRDFRRGFFYWHTSSLDARIPAAVKTGILANRPDGASFLDPGDYGLWHMPTRAYLRDPVYQMTNTFALSGNDYYLLPDGTVPRSIKTVSVMSYPADQHAGRRVAYDDGGGFAIWNYGGYSQSGYLGADGKVPIPLEAIVPDASVCTNLIVPTAFACTKMVWYGARVMLTQALNGQSAGMLAAMYCENSGAISVQNLDYPTFRTRMLALPDSTLPVLPQVL